MEYLFGFFVGTVLMLLSYRFMVKNNLTKTKPILISYRQSHIFNAVKPFADIAYRVNRPVMKTQATDYEKSQTVRVVMTEGQAYWIRNQIFYTADINEDYSVDNDSTRTVDTMSMDRVQLEKIMFIVERLTDGAENDDSNSGNTWLQ
jgi:hypothetical protein